MPWGALRGGTPRPKVNAWRMWILAWLACASPATVVNWCDDNPGACATCTRDADCVFQGNACTETVYCANTDAGIAVVQIGCSAAQEHPWPDAAECTCDAGTCRSPLGDAPP